MSVRWTNVDPELGAGVALGRGRRDGRRTLWGRVGPSTAGGLVAVLVAVVFSLAVTAPASGRLHLPPKHKIYLGVTGGETVDPVVRATGRVPATFQFFVAWDRSIDWTLARTRDANARLMLHMSTYKGPGTPEIITPREIARGRGDDFIVSLGHQVVVDYENKPVYLRLMSEMNGHWNPYAYYNADGSRRDRAHRPYWYRQAFRRVTLILRGGRIQLLNRRLRRLGLPALRHVPTRGACNDGGEETCVDQEARQPVKRLPHANVSMQWVPQTMGSPNIPSNMPARFYPGDRYVDWVGTDFYSKYPTFHFLETFYRHWAVRHGKPFAFAEWAIWGADNPHFIQRFIGWARSHRRVRLISYNQGNETSSPFRLSRFPRASAALRELLNTSTFTGRVPEYSPRAPVRTQALIRQRHGEQLGRRFRPRRGRAVRALKGKYLAWWVRRIDGSRPVL